MFGQTCRSGCVFCGWNTRKGGQDSISRGIRHQTPVNRPHFRLRSPCRGLFPVWLVSRGFSNLVLWQPVGHVEWLSDKLMLCSAGAGMRLVSLQCSDAKLSTLGQRILLFANQCVILTRSGTFALHSGIIQDLAVNKWRPNQFASGGDALMATLVTLPSVFFSGSDRLLFVGEVDQPDAAGIVQLDGAAVSVKWPIWNHGPCIFSFDLMLWMWQVSVSVAPSTLGDFLCTTCELRYPTHCCSWM